MARHDTLAGVRETKATSSWLIRLWQWGILVLLILLWEAGARLGFVDPYFFSSPVEIAQTAVVQWEKGTLWRDVVYTGMSTLLGFVSGTVVGSAVGLLFWFSRPVARVAEPYLVVLNALPKLALAPVLVILLGIGFASKVTLAFLMTVIVAAISAHSGVKEIDDTFTTLMVSLGARRLQIFTRLVVPSAMPWVISGLRVNIALAMAGAIVGEFIASDKGLGRMIVYAGTTFDLKLVWVGVTVLSVLSVLMYLGVVALEKVLSRRWSASANGSQGK
ncbi:MAG: ABC transporter permease [Clostridiales bacterium]|nr:ABC transporter permease [Clostridiales bacterium]